MNVLNLVIKKEPFMQIISGEKKHEYREIKPFYSSRFDGKKYDRLILRNGYASNADFIEIELLDIDKGYSVPEWCGGYRGYFYRLKLGKILYKKIKQQPKIALKNGY